MQHIIKTANGKTTGMWFDEDSILIRRGALSIEVVRIGKSLVVKTCTGDKLIREEKFDENKLLGRKLIRALKDLTYNIQNLLTDGRWE